MSIIPLKYLMFIFKFFSLRKMFTNKIIAFNFQICN